MFTLSSEVNLCIMVQKGKSSKNQFQPQNRYQEQLKWKNSSHQIIILLRKLFSYLMLQYPRQTQTNFGPSSKRQFHSLKYKEITDNTPIYSIPSISHNNNRYKQNKENDKQSDSFETCQSQTMAPKQKTIHFHVRENKIKVELCKNFVEKGYCPYQNRCKFAHGVEELRAKDTWGNCQLYRTRKCKVFYQKNQCKFGQRCNFVHQNRRINEIVLNNSKAVRGAIRMNFQQINFESYTSRVQSSKLLGFLNQNQKNLQN